MRATDQPQATNLLDPIRPISLLHLLVAEDDREVAREVFNPTFNDGARKAELEASMAAQDAANTGVEDFIVVPLLLCGYLAVVSFSANRLCVAETPCYVRCVLRFSYNGVMRSMFPGPTAFGLS